MSKPFSLEIITPEREFVKAQAEAVTVPLSDGQLTIWAGHEPLVANLSSGELRIKLAATDTTGPVWKIAECADGFMEVRPDAVQLFLQDCEWPEDVDERNAATARARAQEKLMQRRSVYEHKVSAIGLTRAMLRLKDQSYKPPD